MIDCEEADVFWEPWRSPVKKKRKQDRKQKIKQVNKTHDGTKKKKKKSKVKEAMEEKKKKQKGKKKTKRKPVLPHAITQAKPKPCCAEKSETQDSTKKTKRKKKVVFDLSPGYICVKRPKFVSSSLQSPDGGASLVNGAVEDGDNSSQVIVTSLTQCEPHYDGSQCPSDDMQSQDLFITQKVFREPPSQTSSGETSKKALLLSPTLSPKCTSALKIGSQDPHIYQTQTNEHPQETNTLLEIFKQDDKKENLLFQTKLESNVNLTKKERASCVGGVKPRVTNPYLDIPVVVETCLDGEKSENLTTNLNQVSTASIFTQTENFFTTELSFYHSFCQKHRQMSHSEDIKPLDLSLPHRARKDLGRCLKVSDTEVQEDQDRHVDKGERKKKAKLKHTQDGGETRCRNPWSVNAQEKDQRIPSPQSESDPKSADTTGSSEDSEAPCRSNRLDLMKVRAVQMRLNESFFFKTKGEALSPRPESPLMKLAQGRGGKSRKGN